jgi:hypothetical protein
MPVLEFLHNTQVSTKSYVWHVKHLCCLCCEYKWIILEPAPSGVDAFEVPVIPDSGLLATKVKQITSK